MTHSSWLLLLGGAAGGAIVSQAGAWIMAWRRNVRENAALAAAFCGEISALLDLAKTRRYREIYQKNVEELRAGVTTLPLGFKTTKEYFKIYDRNADKIGHLGRHASDISAFYTYANGFLEDVEILLKIQAFPEAYRRAIVQQIIDIELEMLQIFDKTMDLGWKVVRNLETPKKNHYEAAAKATCMIIALFGCARLLQGCSPASATSDPEIRTITAIDGSQCYAFYQGGDLRGGSCK